MSRPSLFLLALLFSSYVIETDMAISSIEDDDKISRRDDKSEDTMTYLEMHVAFFDYNKDGIIYPWELFAGFRQLGYNLYFSTLFTVIFSGTFSYPTSQKWLPSLLFPIYIANIHKCKHGSDTGNYDYDGRFDEENFEIIVKRYAKTLPDKLTLGELWRMTEDHHLIFDFFGWNSAKFEFGLLYFLAKDDDGSLSIEAFSQVYNGTLFYNIVNKNNKNNKLKIN